MTKTTYASLEGELAAGELAATAFHGVGHSTVCRLLGGKRAPYIWRNTPEKVAAGERAWRGTFVMLQSPGTYSASICWGIRKCQKRWPVLLGLAGLVSEAIKQGTRDPDQIAREIEDIIALDEASPSDLALVGQRWHGKDVAAAQRLLLGAWSAVEAEADWIVASGANSTGP